MSCYEGNLEAARYLLSLDADPNSAHTAGGGNTPLHEAARGGSLEATLLLLKSSANVIAANSHGDLPLHVACRHGRVDIARRLLAHDRDDDWTTVTARNHAGLTPADVVHGCAALSSLLEQVHISLTAEDGDDAPATAGAGAAGSRSRSRERSSSSHRSSSKSRGAADHGLGNSGGGGGPGGRALGRGLLYSWCTYMYSWGVFVTVFASFSGRHSSVCRGCEQAYCANVEKGASSGGYPLLGTGILQQQCRRCIRLRMRTRYRVPAQRRLDLILVNSVAVNRQHVV